MTAPRRRWFAFSLRTMFVCVTLGSLAICWAEWRYSGPEICISLGEDSLNEHDRSNIAELIRSIPSLKRARFATVCVMDADVVLVEGSTRKGSNLVYGTSAVMIKIGGSWKIDSIQLLR